MGLNVHTPAGPIEQKWDRHRFNLKLVNLANKRGYRIIVAGSGLACATDCRPAFVPLSRHVAGCHPCP